MLCEVAYITQGKASQKALDLVDISVAYFCRISFHFLGFFLKQLIYLPKYFHTGDKAPELLSVTIMGIINILSSVAIIRMC